MNYYNENDPVAAAWLRELIRQNLIPRGDVDDRSITEVKSHEITRYTQRHFFAGIGGWPLALRLAGWPENEPIDTGSCPCQPISGSGEQRGERDARHLWPELFRLARELRPWCIIGEQVASGDGYEWADGIGLDLESEGYDFAAVDIPARAVGADHERRRLWWTAYSAGERLSKPRLCRQDTIMHKATEFREADGLVHAFRRRELPFLCRGHDGLSIGVARGASKGFGNAIVPQAAAAFIQAAEEARFDCAGVVTGNRMVTPAGAQEIIW